MIPLVWLQRMLASSCLYTCKCHCLAVSLHTSYSNVNANQGSSGESNKTQQSLEKGVSGKNTLNEQQNNINKYTKGHKSGTSWTQTSSKDSLLMQKENDKVLATKYIDNKDGQRYESLGKKLVERNAEIHEDIEETKEKDLMTKIMCNTVEEEKVVIFDNTIVRQITLSENNDASPPAPPTTCCMSGCHNCVWIEYADCLARHYRDGGVEACRKIEKEIEDPSLRAYILMEVRLKGLGK